MCTIVLWTYPATISALVGANHAVVSLIGVGIESHVGPDVDLSAILVLDLGDERGDQAVGVVALVRSIGLELLWDLWEENHVRDTLSDSLTYLLEHAGLSVALTSRHRRDRLVVVLSVDEEGVDEVGGLDFIFSSHAADAFVLPVTPRASTLGNPNVALLIHAKTVVGVAGESTCIVKKKTNKVCVRETFSKPTQR
jgi:hypothetical protein